MNVSPTSKDPIIKDEISLGFDLSVLTKRVNSSCPLMLKKSNNARSVHSETRIDRIVIVTNTIPVNVLVIKLFNI